MECGELKKRFDMLKADRYNIEGIWQIIENFVVPYRGRFFEPYHSELEVEWRQRQIFDGTAIIANENLASNIQSGLTNPAFPWFEFTFRQPELNTIQEAKAWLSRCSELTLKALQESNFYLASGETYLDLPSYGTSILVEEAEEGDDGTLREIDFQACPVEEAYFDQDTKGQIVYFFRRFQWTPTQIVTKFGKDGVPDYIARQYDAAESGTHRHEVIYGIYPREDKQDADTFSVLAATERPFGFKYFLHKDATRLGDEGGYYEMPAYVPRWRTSSGSMWGHSPAMVCLSDILTLNQLVELILVAAEKVVDPPILTTRRGVFGDVDLQAGGETVVASMDSIQPFQSGARFDVSQLQKEELQKSIRQAFYMDQLQLKESPAMTATEVQARFELMNRLMGPTLSRLQYDFLDPLVKRTFKILFRYGQLPQPPEVIAQAGASLDVEYLGPMARAQKTEKSMSIERWVGTIAGISEMFPEARDVVNVDAVAKSLGNNMNVPPDVMNTDAQIQTIRQQRAAAQKQAQDLENAKTGSEAIKNVADVIPIGAAGGQTGG